MSQDVLHQNCISHQQRIVAIDLSLSTHIQDKYLCIKCLENQSSKKRQITLIEDVNKKLLEMKQDESNQYKQVLMNHKKQMSDLLQKFQEFQNEFITNYKIVFELINEAILQSNKQIDNIKEQNFETFAEQDIIDLSNYENKEVIQNKYSIFQKYPIIAKIQEQLQKLLNDDKIQDLQYFIQNLSRKNKFSQSLIRSNLILNKPQSFVDQKGQEDYQKFQADRQQTQTKIKEIIMNCQKNNSYFYEQLLKLIELQISNVPQNLSQQEEIIEQDQQNQKVIFLKFCNLSSNQQQLLQLLNEQFKFNFKNAEDLEILIRNTNFEYFKTLIKKLPIEKIVSILYPNILAQYNQFQEIMREITSTVSMHLQAIKRQKGVTPTNEELLSQTQMLSQIQIQIQKILKNDSEKVDQQLQAQKDFDIHTQHIIESHQLQNTQISYLQVTKLFNLKFQVFKRNQDYVEKQIFSKTSKHQSITINSDGRKASTGLNHSYAVCICDKPLPKEGIITVDLKIINMSYMFFGICFKDFVKPNYICDNFGQVGHGYYFLCNNSYYCSHHDQQINNKPNGFQYQAGDTIEMQINMQNQTVTWRKKSTNENCEMKFQVEKELFVFCQLHQNAEVELQ